MRAKTQAGGLPSALAPPSMQSLHPGTDSDQQGALSVARSKTARKLNGRTLPLSDEAAEEASLVARVGRQDAAAYATLINLHIGPILNFANRTLSDMSEAEDVAQETFLRLWKNAARWRPEAKLTTWLHRVAYNLCMDRLRKKRPGALEDVPEQVDEADSPSTTVIKAETAEIIAGAVDDLPARQRAAITLVHYQELTNIEAAQIMEISVDALESLLARGRRKLKGALKGQRALLMGGT